MTIYCEAPVGAMLSRPKLIGTSGDRCNVSYIAPTGARLVLAMEPGVETPGYGCLAPPERRIEAPFGLQFLPDVSPRGVGVECS